MIASHPNGLSVQYSLAHHLQIPAYPIVFVHILHTDALISSAPIMFPHKLHLCSSIHFDSGSQNHASTLKRAVPNLLLDIIWSFAIFPVFLVHPICQHFLAHRKI